MPRGRFITFEGGEGAGKTTQLRLLGERLQRRGLTPCLTREPGGCPLAERIRGLLVGGTGTDAPMTPETELLLMVAARAQHVAEVIRPALARGDWVLCDRFNDSTLAYQGHGRGLDRDWIAHLIRQATGGLQPDRTYLLDLDPRVGLARSRGGAMDEARFEGEGLAFHQRVREGFLDLARRAPERFRVQEAAAALEAVAERIWRETERDWLRV
ncbi:MAG: dTMP kinase [Magnetococcales bacterium]|nr:dTMP kinase [Magnetococcales bacterium]